MGLLVIFRLPPTLPSRGSPSVFNSSLASITKSPVSISINLDATNCSRNVFSMAIELLIATISGTSNPESPLTETLLTQRRFGKSNSASRALSLRNNDCETLPSGRENFPSLLLFCIEMLEADDVARRPTSGKVLKAVSAMIKFSTARKLKLASVKEGRERRINSSTEVSFGKKSVDSLARLLRRSSPSMNSRVDDVRLVRDAASEAVRSPSSCWIPERSILSSVVDETTSELIF